MEHLTSWAAHTLFTPPARSYVCDRCGGGLFRRDEDSPNVSRRACCPTDRRRRPLDHYRTLGKLRPVDGTRPVAEIVPAALA